MAGGPASSLAPVRGRAIAPLVNRQHVCKEFSVATQQDHVAMHNERRYVWFIKRRRRASEHGAT
jgi:hypothetical protein